MMPDNCLQYIDLVLPAITEHLILCISAVALGTLTAVPLGIYLAVKPKRAAFYLSLSGSIQTIPSLAFYGLLLPLLGIGRTPAITVLGLYSIMPILRGTFTSIRNIEPLYIENARALGMNWHQLITKILIPLALPGILASIRLSLIYIINWATIAAMIGAGGLGDLILGGIYNYDITLILSGALPVALLAVLSGLFFNQLIKLSFIPGYNISPKESS